MDMPPVSPQQLLPLALQGIQHLPKLRRRKDPAAELRFAAYNQFTAAVWESASGGAYLQILYPIVRKPVAGIFWLPATRRQAESSFAAVAKFAGAFEQLRLVAPVDVREHAGAVAEHLAMLMDALTDPVEHSKRRDLLGEALRDFVVACRVDLGYDRAPNPVVLNWWNPVTWWRWATWRWRRRR